MLPTLVAQAAHQYGVPARLVAAIVVVESSCRNEAVSETGAVGLMQVIPRIHGTTRKRLLDPGYNVRMGTSIISASIHRYGLREGIKNYYGSADDAVNELYADKIYAVWRGR